MTSKQLSQVKAYMLENLAIHQDRRGDVNRTGLAEDAMMNGPIPLSCAEEVEVFFNLASSIADEGDASPQHMMYVEKRVAYELDGDVLWMPV